MNNVPGLRYHRLIGFGPDCVAEVELVASMLVAAGRFQGMLKHTVTHPLRRAMIDLTPEGKYIECRVDWAHDPAREKALWEFWFEDDSILGGKR